MAFLVLKSITGELNYFKTTSTPNGISIQGVDTHASIEPSDEILTAGPDWDLVKQLLLHHSGAYDLTPKRTDEGTVISIKTKEEVPITIGKIRLEKSGGISEKEFLEAFALEAQLWQSKHREATREASEAKRQLEDAQNKYEEAKGDYERILRDTEEKFYHLLNAKKDRIRQLTQDEPWELNGCPQRKKIKGEPRGRESSGSTESFRVGKEPSIELRDESDEKISEESEQSETERKWENGESKSDSEKCERERSDRESKSDSEKERNDLESEGNDLENERKDLESERKDLESERKELERERKIDVNSAMITGESVKIKQEPESQASKTDIDAVSDSHKGTDYSSGAETVYSD